MSGASKYQLVFFYHDNNLQLYGLEGKKWESLGQDINLDKPFKKELAAKVAGKNAIVLISDSSCGHLQFIQENKKSNLSEEAITQLLQEEYDIETSAYELLWQNYTLSRQTVQISVTGIDRDILGKLEKWLTEQGVAKARLIPFAWFVSPLKAVDPAVVAIIINKQVHVSHHYLGIDDARVLDIKDLPRYLEVRQQERKDTHLLYLLADDKTQAKLEKLLADQNITVQSLLEINEGNKDWLGQVVQSIMSDHLPDVIKLLHFELSFVEEEEEPAEKGKGGKGGAAAPAAAPLSLSKKISDSVDSTDNEAAVNQLPPPKPPASLQEGNPTELIAESAADSKEVSQDVATEETDEPASADVKQSPTDKSDSDASIGEKVTSPAPPVQSTNQPVAKSESSSVSDIDDTKSASGLSSAGEPSKSQNNKSSDSEKKSAEPAISQDETQAQSEPELESEQTDKLDSIFSELRQEKPRQSEIESRYTQAQTTKSTWKLPLVVFLLVTLVTSGLMGGLVWSGTLDLDKLANYANPANWSQIWQRSDSNESELPQPTTPLPEENQATDSASPSATDEAELTDETGSESQSGIDKSEPSILILNATGINGLAGRVRQELVAEGWEGNIEVGNATGTYDDATFVLVKDETYLSELAADLENELTTVESLSEVRADQFDIVLILAED